MEEPESIPVVQAFHEIDQKLQDINHSLQGKEGGFLDQMESINTSLYTLQDKIKVLRSDLEIQKQHLHEIRLSYEAEADRP